MIFHGPFEFLFRNERLARPFQSVARPLVGRMIRCLSYVDSNHPTHKEPGYRDFTLMKSMNDSVTVIHGEWNATANRSGT